MTCYAQVALLFCTVFALLESVSPVCVSIADTATDVWCVANCYVPGTLILAPACNPTSESAQVCTCAAQLQVKHKCIEIDARVTNEWCEVNCYAPGTGLLHPACDPTTNILDRVCACTSAVACVGNWTELGSCTAECGGGVAMYLFEVTVEAANGGNNCTNANGDLVTKSCNTKACVHGSVCPWNNTILVNGEGVCANGTALVCVEGALLQNGTCGKETTCQFNDTVVAEGATVYDNGTIFVCTSGALVQNGTYVASSCVSIDIRATTAWCEINCYAPGTWDLHPACSPESPVQDRVCDCNQTQYNETRCISTGTVYLSGDFECRGAELFRCVNGSFAVTGTCSLPQFIDCSAFDAVCVSAYSVALAETLVFCGLNQTFPSTQTLCYTDNAEHYCDNDREGTHENWIMRSHDSIHIGLECPAF